MKKIFLDLGTHLGQGLSQFINTLHINGSWDIYSFEANPVTFKKFNGLRTYANTPFNVTFLNKAVATQNGKVIINAETPPNEDETGMGSSIMKLAEWNPWGDVARHHFKTCYEVESFDFSEFVNSLGNSEIYCKMDIEGAEFDVLEQMIKSKSIEKIKEIWIEFHDHYFVDKNSYIDRKNEIIKYLVDNNITYHLWH